MPDSMPVFAGVQTATEERLEKLLATLSSPESRSLTALLTLWRGREMELWSCSPAPYRLLGQRVLEVGEPLFAYDVLAEGLGIHRDDVRLRQLYAWALSRSGATERANAHLTQLKQAGQRDEETLGMLARTHKDLSLRATDPDERKRHQQLAFEGYLEAYRSTGGYYPGINAATMALLAGELGRAQEIAREVRAICLEKISRDSDGKDAYWLAATLGEAALILNEWPEVANWYSRAAELGRGQIGLLSSTRLNALRITDFLGIDRHQIDRYLAIPKVVVFAGHMIDRPGRQTPRFPGWLEQRVRHEIRSRLEQISPCIGYASPACGADIIFLEEVLDLGGETQIVLPFNLTDFLAESVEIVPGSAWGQRCVQAIERASKVLVASEQKMEGGAMSYAYSFLMLHGLAAMRADQLQSDLLALAVWDGKEGDGFGGTASAVEHWKETGQPVEVVNLSELLDDEIAGGRVFDDPADYAPYVSTDGAVASDFAAEITAVLFADAVHFSRLTEEELPRFVRHFLGDIGNLAHSSEHPPIFRNTWGDGIYLVFSTAHDAGLFALELCDMITCTDWTTRGLPAALNLRIALHAGPVYSCTDPVTGRRNYIGTHVSHAARIEPITPPGQVFTSQAFAALAAAQRVGEFTCEYVGQTPLAKDHGTFPTYLLRRRV